MAERRLIVGPCRSGTTMLLRSAKNHPDVSVEFQTIKEHQRRTGRPGYDFYARAVGDGGVLVNKETVGYGNEEDCALEVFPDDASIAAVRPAFIFREPRETFASWLEQNLVPEGNPRLFIAAYRHTYALLLRAQAVSPHASVYTYDGLCADREREIRALCKQWGMMPHPDMIEWKDAFIDSTPLDKSGVDEGHYAAVAGSTGIHAKREKPALDAGFSREIADALGEIYARIVAMAMERQG